VANELSSIFPSANSGSQSPIQVGGRGGRGGRGGGNPFAVLFGGGNNANTSQQRLQKAQQISAVADSRIQAVVVTAPKSLMDQITDVMAQLDVPSDRDQTVTVIPVVNGDPYQVAAVLQNTFGGSQTARGGTSSAASGALQLRLQDSATIMGNPASTTTSSGIGGTGGGGGGRAF
jgi:type II secretory pathway component GspD/PulD (secretin)